ncbi:MAG TPA: helix-turn-helix domain-containing protein, partial [Acidimicrobiales bacterium]|nr:helix-turn-helix domain-containing protein [Acidimicrobiales bacterium]
MPTDQEVRASAGAAPGDRRARRRRETITEILDIALAVMAEEGVNGLSLAEVARRLGVRPPSLYKYFASIMAVYDALFLRGQVEHL